MAKVIICDKCNRKLNEGEHFVEMVLMKKLNTKESLQLCEGCGKEFERWLKETPPIAV